MHGNLFDIGRSRTRRLVMELRIELLNEQAALIFYGFGHRLQVAAFDGDAQEAIDQHNIRAEALVFP